MMNPYLGQLERIATVMGGLQGDDQAKIGYSMFADALMWTDEYPDFSSPMFAHIPLKDLECMKLVLHYRTSVIVGDPDVTCEKYWIEARQLFPTWCGFKSERRATALRDEFLRLRRDSLEEFDRECE